MDPTRTWPVSKLAIAEAHIQKVAQRIVVLRGPVLRFMHLLDYGKIGLKQKLAGNLFPPTMYLPIRVGSVPPPAIQPVFYVAN